MRHIILLATLVSASACESTYHPEYHPVTVTDVHQSWNGGVTTVGGYTPAYATPTQPVPRAMATAGVTTFAPGQPIVIQEPALADPEVVFRGR